MLQRHHVIAGCFAALVLANASPAVAADSEIITACLQERRDADRDARKCIGRVSGPCMGKPEGQSTVGMVECISTETQAWDDILNKEYRRLLPLLKSEAAEDVKKAQRLWIQARDADCRIPYYFCDGGSIVQTLGAQCVLDHTADRALLLRSWREMAQGE